MSTPGTMPPPGPPLGAPGAPPAKKSLLWLWIILGVVGCAGIAVVALAVLGALFFTRRVSAGFSEAQSMTARQQIENFRSALELYDRDCGSYPSTAQGLEALVHDPGSCHGWKAYLDGPEVPKDPWGHPYRYSFPGTHGSEPEIVSAGPDGMVGTNDDVTSW